MTSRPEEFTATVAQSPLGGAELVAGIRAGDWNQAPRSLAIALPDDTPAIAVIDEVPWPVEQDPEFEGALQTVWDRHLSGKPVLLLLVGSDISVMEALGSRDRPFGPRDEDDGRAAARRGRPDHDRARRRRRHRRHPHHRLLPRDRALLATGAEPPGFPARRGHRPPGPAARRR
ncbi:hypothetical protein AB0H71_26405 [Nocardia sp. NPDC050697]|uniref:hypothetical protein n=1 Tax=Nocardia sp. NPDC050697 TaxID=3155158 RepID=UPI00340FD153